MIIEIIISYHLSLLPTSDLYSDIFSNKILPQYDMVVFYMSQAGQH